MTTETKGDDHRAVVRAQDERIARTTAALRAGQAR